VAVSVTPKDAHVTSAGSPTEGTGSGVEAQPTRQSLTRFECGCIGEGVPCIYVVEGVGRNGKVKALSCVALWSAISLAIVGALLAGADIKFKVLQAVRWSTHPGACWLAKPPCHQRLETLA
jgi:hypothetical protein